MDSETAYRQSGHAQCAVCPGPCSFECHWYMAAHSEAEYEAAVEMAAQFNLAVAVRLEFDHTAHAAETRWRTNGPYGARLPQAPGASRSDNDH